MSKPAIHLEELGEGARVFKDKVHLVAIFKCRDHQGGTKQIVQGGTKITVYAWDDMPYHLWSLHWVTPEVTVELVEAVIAALPKPK